MSQILSVLWQYRRARQRSFGSRDELEHYQAKSVSRHLEWVSRHSPYYREFSSQPLAKWPMVDKHACLDGFDAMNTAGLRLEEARTFAMNAEVHRNFSATLRGYTIGLSSGTSGTRGIFVASARERALWAGLALNRLLPNGIFRGERIAFFLRANSTLYTSVQSPWISFKFFDLMSPLAAQLGTLASFRPTIIVAPAQVLRYLAMEHQAGLPLVPKKVISVAEVLEYADRELIRGSFSEIAEVYQATEGFLGYTCAHGRLHLNEEYLHIEPEWLDASRTRMVPLITDFSRTTQPVIRYRLNDVLAVDSTPCSCGNPTRTLAHIEGRCDDQLSLPSRQGGFLPVFSDALSRALLRALPVSADYRLVQQGANGLQLTAALGDAQAAVRASLNAQLQEMGVAVDELSWSFIDGHPDFDPSTKRRRIIRSAT